MKLYKYLFILKAESKTKDTQLKRALETVTRFKNQISELQAQTQVLKSELLIIIVIEKELLYYSISYERFTLVEMIDEEFHNTNTNEYDDC